MWIHAIVLLLSLVLFATGPAHSEPIMITGGFIEGTPGLIFNTSLTGEGLTYTGAGYDWTAVSPTLCAPCFAGRVQPFTQSITAGDQFIAGGRGTLNGTSFTVPWPPLNADLELRLSGTYTVPSVFGSGLGSQPVGWTITTPFTMGGYIDPVELDRFDVVGNGTLTLTASTRGFPSDEGVYIATNVRFDFQSMPGSASPVPEPGSIALLAAGVGGLAALRRRTPARYVQ